MNEINIGKVQEILAPLKDVQEKQGERLKGVLSDMKGMEKQAKEAGRTITTTTTALNETKVKLDPHTDIAVREESDKRRAKDTNSGGY